MVAPKKIYVLYICINGGRKKKSNIVEKKYLKRMEKICNANYKVNKELKRP